MADVKGSNMTRGRMFLLILSLKIRKNRVSITFFSIMIGAAIITVTHVLVGAPLAGVLHPPPNLLLINRTYSSQLFWTICGLSAFTFHPFESLYHC